jgi:tetratricopeptide (TPR) repeat protein
MDVVRHRYTAAATRYRRVVDRYTNYPEARLGLGMALALSGEIERNHLAQRQKFLRAIAQFAAVKPGDTEYPEARFDRALLLERVGRREEAEALAAGTPPVH